MNDPYPYAIRLMEPGDIPTVSAIEGQSFPTPWPPSSYIYELSHNTRSFFYVLLRPEEGPRPEPEAGWRRWLQDAVGLRRNSRVIGYTGFRLRPAEVHLSTIAVHPAWRGKGLGELLLITTIERALDLGAQTISLEVRASNRVAQNLYRKFGFRFTGVHQTYYQDGEDAWLMEVNVSGATYRTRLDILCRNLRHRLQHQNPVVGQNVGDRL